MNPASQEPRRISLDPAEAWVQQFIQSIKGVPAGSVLECQGEAVVRVLPAEPQAALDRVRLTAAILERRNQSRQLTADWEAVDRETWEDAAPLD